MSIIILFISCKKGLLDKKPDKALVIPITLQDLQALLDNDGIFILNQPALGEVGSDNYYLHPDVLTSLYVVERNSYLWAKDIYEGETFISDWDAPYQQVFYANTVLEKVNKISVNAVNQKDWNNVKGSALFDRSFAFYNLAQIFAKPYDSSTANTDLGIPLRLTSDFNEPVGRATVQDTYNQIISDLVEAKDLLPVTPMGKNRPSKPAVFSLLARTYLSMGDYNNAFFFADSCLQLYSTLIDYNSIDTTAYYSFPPYGNTNDEIIYHGSLANYSGLRNSAIIDSVLYKSYTGNDLRKSVFFTFRDTNVVFKGSYWGSRSLFGGIASDEIYLIRAECNARRGNTMAAMNDLNTLLQTRWRTGTFIPYSAINSNDALNQILSERRKELLLRGLRWTDLRRLNKDPRFAVTLIRNINGQAYALPPNDNRYVYPIPNEEILYNNIPQNPR